MCGIIGYVGTRRAAEVLLQGLSKLEYRGYDSAGVATVGEGGLELLKTVGKLGVLASALASAAPAGSTGLGHTRWATHGAPSEANAHPHTDCSGRLALVHNGIIENCEALRRGLEERGHTFKSQTDSEVLAHMVEEILEQGEGELLEALRLALERVQGSYAVALVDSRRPLELVAARNGSPLVLGLGEGENFAASDASAILPYTRRVVYLGDYQLARISGSSVAVRTLAGQDVPVNAVNCEWDPLQSEKGVYTHYMRKEIDEQPDVLERMVARSEAPFEGDLFETLNLTPAEARRARRAVILGCGTSWHAGLVAKHLFETLAGLPTEVDVSSEFRYRNLLVDGETLVIGVSQSGETADTLCSLKRIRGKAQKILSICNVMESSIPRESDGVLYTQAGPEVGVASTKCYTAQLAAFTLLAMRLAAWRGASTGQDLRSLRNALAELPGKMRQALERSSEAEALAAKYADARDFLFLGRGVNTATAMEGALKLKEIAYIHATGHPAGEMKHGPIALIDRRMPVVCLLSAAHTYEKMMGNVQEVRARGGRVIAVAADGDAEAPRQAEDVLWVPPTTDLLTPLLAVIPLQLLAYHMAVKRGCDVDQPRNLAKSVTVE